MEEVKKCGCGGMNDECMYCGGSGNIIQGKIEFIKINPTKKELAKEKEGLKNYLHPNDEKLYVSKKPYKNKALKKIQSNLKKVELQIKQPKIIISESSFNHIGPNNPNRTKLGDTRNLGVTKGIPVKKRKR